MPGHRPGRPPLKPPSGGATQVEGRQAVRELLRAGTRRVRQVQLATGPRSVALGEIADLAAAAGATVRWVGPDQLDAVARTEAHQGVIAVAAPVREWSLDELLAARDPFLVVLDGVTDPRNLGAVMRSALGAGATGIVVGRHRTATLTPAAVKAAAGAVEYLPLAPVAGVPAALSRLGEAGVWTVGLDAGGSSSLWDLGVADQPVALVLGAEGRGLSPLARARCDLVAAVPMAGPLGSLNVAAAAALGCFEVARRRRPGVR